MSLGTILIVVLILILVGVIPTWPHSRSWGYTPQRRARTGGGHHTDPALIGKTIIAGRRLKMGR